MGITIDIKHKSTSHLQNMASVVTSDVKVRGLPLSQSFNVLVK